MKRILLLVTLALLVHTSFGQVAINKDKLITCVRTKDGSYQQVAKTDESISLGFMVVNKEIKFVLQRNLLAINYNIYFKKETEDQYTYSGIYNDQLAILKIGEHEVELYVNDYMLRVTLSKQEIKTLRHRFAKLS